MQSVARAGLEGRGLYSSMMWVSAPGNARQNAALEMKRESGTTLDEKLREAEVGTRVVVIRSYIVQVMIPSMSNAYHRASSIMSGVSSCCKVP